MGVTHSKSTVVSATNGGLKTTQAINSRATVPKRTFGDDLTNRLGANNSSMRVDSVMNTQQHALQAHMHALDQQERTGSNHTSNNKSFDHQTSSHYPTHASLHLHNLKVKQTGQRSGSHGAVAHYSQVNA